MNNFNGTESQRDVLYRCFLRDFVGANNSLHKGFYVFVIKHLNQKSGMINLIARIRLEPVKIVSFGYYESGQSGKFGDFIQKRAQLSQFSALPVLPDSALLHFTLELLTQVDTDQSVGISIITWLSQFVDFGLNPADDPMGEDSDVDSDDEIFNDVVHSEDSFKDHHRSLLLNFLRRGFYTFRA